MIQGHGPSKPLAFLISDAPQGEDNKTNYAISGYQGNLLKKLLKEANLNFDQFYKTCLIKDPTDSTFGWPKADELDAARPYGLKYGSILINEIKALEPFLLIPLGELSFNFLTTLRGIRKFRGSVVNSNPECGLDEPVKVLPLLGPYPYIYADPKQQYITRIDIGKIQKYLNYSPPPDNLHNIWVCRSAAALRTFLERSFTPEGILFFDIETFAGIPTCISFCFDGFESVCVPFFDQSIDRDNRTLMIDMVAKVLYSSIRKVNQNIKYDWKILERWGFIVNNVVGDTMLAAGCLYCEFPKNLGFLTSIYTDLPYFKDEGREFNPFKAKKDQLYLYNAKDSLATNQIYYKQQAEIDEQGVRFVYDNLIQLMPIYRKMEDTGIRIDDETRLALLSKYITLFEVHLRQIRIMSGRREFNPQSPKQCDDLIFNELGFKKVRGVKGTDEESLLLLLAYGDDSKSPLYGKAILEEIIACRKIHKVIEILELPLYPDKRFRCEYSLTGTDTGRTSASKTTDKIFLLDEKGKVIKESLGHSLQTIGKHGFIIDGVHYGKDIRGMFVPSPGYIFSEHDLSQAEARVDAVLSGNYEILEVFDGPVGIHRLTGSWVFDCDPSDIKKGTLQYHLAKTVRHAAERNMQADRLMAMTQQPIALCNKILTKFHTKQPEIRGVFHRDVMALVNTTRCLIAPNGRRHDYFDRIDQHVYNKAISFLPQAIVSDQTKFSFVKTLSEAPYARLLAEAHDGALFEEPRDKKEEFALIYKRNVETPIDFRKGSISRPFELTIPCESSFGENWNDMKELKIK